MASNDIKDKRPLVENRKLIETVGSDGETESEHGLKCLFNVTANGEIQSRGERNKNKGLFQRRFLLYLPTHANVVEYNSLQGIHRLLVCFSSPAFSRLQWSISYVVLLWKCKTL